MYIQKVQEVSQNLLYSQNQSHCLLLPADLGWLGIINWYFTFYPDYYVEREEGKILQSVIDWMFTTIQDPWIQYQDMQFALVVIVMQIPFSILHTMNSTITINYGCMTKLEMCHKDIDG